MRLAMVFTVFYVFLHHCSEAYAISEGGQKVVASVA